MSGGAGKSVKGHRHGRVPRAFREEQLLDVAQKLFGAQGYQGTSIENIAEAAGVSRPIVYDHFKSKDDIYLACLRRARSRLETDVSKSIATATTAKERLHRGIDVYFQLVESNGPAWEVLFGGGVAVAGPAAKEARKLRLATVSMIARLLKEILPATVPDQRVEIIAHSMSGAGELLTKWWRENPDVPRSQLVNDQVSLFWTGLEGLIRS